MCPDGSPSEWASPFVGNSAMAVRMRAFDWAATPLGPPESWPATLRTACRICLTSRFPILLWWGAELRMLYNDAYAPILGDKHPALAMPGQQAWSDVWPIVGPMLDEVRAGASTWSDDQMLPMYRRGYWEEAYFTFSYSPIHGEDGSVLGIFTVVAETTARVLGDRRLRTLRELGEISAADAATAEQAMATALNVMARNRADIPHAVAYALAEDGATARLVGSYGVSPGSGFAPTELSSADGDELIWRVVRTGEPELLSGLRDRHTDAFVTETMLFDKAAPPDEAMVLPIVASGQVRPAGVLIAVVSSTRALDGEYRSFFDLVAGQISTAVTTATAYAAEHERVEALAELDRVKSEFFANVSHEFRVPLTLISGPVEEALADPDLSDTGRELLDMVQRNAGCLRRLVDDMLDFARIEAGRLQPETVATDLASLTREIVESFAPAIVRAGLRLTVRCPALGASVRVDPDMWEKVVLNLLSNAVKYTQEGGLEVTLRAAGRWVELTVTDTGVGIPADELPLLFQRFHRVRGAGGRSYEGAGIGLALVQELVRLHGGTVSVDSAEGHGATFTVRLPYDPQADPASPSVSRQTRGRLAHLDEALQWSAPAATGTPVETPTASGPGTTAGATVLVIEDNTDLRRFITRLLAPHWTVLEAADGRSGLVLARDHRPELVLTDVMMPEMDGFGLLRALRGDRATAAVPVVLLSARAGAEAAVEGLSAGADDYLPKPFSAQELVARVRANLELSRFRNRESEFRRVLVDSLHEGVVVTDEHATVIELNPAFADITGYGPEGLPYHYPYPWLCDLEDDAEGRRMTDAALTALRVQSNGEFLLPVRHRRGHRLWVAVSTRSLPDRDGHGHVAVNTVRDVTAQRAVAEHETILARFTAALSGAADVTDVLTVGTRELQGVFGGKRTIAALWPTETTPALLVGHPTTPSSGELDQAAADALRAARVRPLQDVVEQPSMEDPQRIVGLSAPLSADGTAAVWLDFGGPRPVDAPDSMLFASLVSHLAHVLTRARSYDQNRSVALTLQHAILGPTRLPRGFAVRYEPAVRPLEVGGDWYDVTRLADGRVVVVVGDCVGRGLPAAAVMGQLRSACQALLLRATGPAHLLADLDAYAERLPDALCTTVFCAIIDTTGDVVHYSSAGHLPALLAHPDGSSHLLDDAPGLPLAVDPGKPRCEGQATLRPGSTVLLYTDGLVERRTVSFDAGIDHARRVLVANHHLGPDRLADELMAAMAPPAGYDDDVAVLLYRHPPTPLRCQLRADPAELATLRVTLRGWLGASAVPPEVTDAVVLAVNEAATNAVEHGCQAETDHTVIITAAQAADRLEVTVSDNGQWKPPSSDAGHRGHGMAVIRAVMDAVTVEPGPHGTTVRMSVYLD